MFFLSGAIPVVYVLTRIREIRRTQLNIYSVLLCSLLRKHASTLSKGHHQAVDINYKVNGCTPT
jgi:hypothetical protein